MPILNYLAACLYNEMYVEGAMLLWLQFELLLTGGGGPFYHIPEALMIYQKVNASFWKALKQETCGRLTAVHDSL